MSSKIIQAFRKKMFPSHLINRQVQCLLTLKNLRPDSFQSLFSRNFINVKNSKTGHKAKTVILENFNKKPAKATSLRELVQKKFINTSKELKNPDTLPVQPFTTFSIWNVLGIGMLIDILLALVVSKTSEYYCVNSVLENGTQPKPKVMKDKFISRPQISKTLMKVFQPNEHQSFYHVICGKLETGKTTLIRTEATNIGKGIIYINIPSNVNDLGKAFEKAFNLSFFEDISFTVKLLQRFFPKEKTSAYQLERAMKIFKRASKVYKKNNNGKLPIIIYDNINKIDEKNTKILDILQNDAMDHAYNKEYIAVFVIGENSVLRRMELNRNAWHRADNIIEIDNLNKEESMEYLIKNRKINEIEAKKIYDLIGGYILELEIAADHFLHGQSFEDIKKQVLIRVEKRLEIAKFLREQSHHKVGKKVIKALLDSNAKELSFTSFMQLFGNYKEGTEVLETNIFTYHPEKHTVTFQSKSVEYYIQENANVFIE